MLLKRDSIFITYDEIVLFKLGEKALIDKETDTKDKDQTIAFTLKELELTKKVNDHARVRFTGIIKDEDKQDWINMANSKTAIVINYINENSKPFPLFRGLVTNIIVRFDAKDGYLMEVDGLSYTYELDLEPKNRSFPDKSMKYQQLINDLLSEYPRALFTDQATANAPLNQFILQHRETDWQFLTRLASHFKTGLVAAVDNEVPDFYFGIPCEEMIDIQEGTQKSTNERVSQMVKTIIDSNSNCNYTCDIAKRELLSFELKTYRVLNIGDTVNLSFNKTADITSQTNSSSAIQDNTVTLPFSVLSVHAKMEGSTLVFYYQLVTKKSLNQGLLYNRQTSGLSLEGTVIERSKDQVKVHLQIDKDYDQSHKCQKSTTEKGAFFPYATFYTAEGNTGWYCMPEEGDTVNLYFRTCDETKGVVTDSIRKETQKGEKISDPSIKYFRFKGTEVRFSEGNILLTLNQYDEKNKKDVAVASIELNEETGIKIYAQTDLEIKAGRNMIIDAPNGNVKVSAGALIDMSCQGSGISLNGVTNLKGKEVKNN